MPARLAALTGLLLLLVLLVGRQQVSGAQLDYEPELQQDDGIPLLSARGGGPAEQAPAAAAAGQRRQDPDLDEGAEDEDDEDAFPSGSSRRERLDAPSYGESRRAQRDGDEIESFFDRHLGPPAADQEPSSTSASGAAELPARDPDDSGDDYAAAASGPIASFLHNLIFHSHQAGGGAADAPAAAPSASKGQTQAQATAGEPASKAAPAALVAAPSSLVAYEPQQAFGRPETDEPPAEPSGGLREIYIGRRPTVMSYLQQAAAAASAAAEPGQQQAAYFQQPHTAAGSAHVWRTQQGYQQALLPVAASYAYRQQYGQPAAGQYSSASEPAADDELTVTYGLSLGSRPHQEHQPSEDDPRGASQLADEAGPLDQDQPQMTAQMIRAQQRQQRRLYQQQVAASQQAGYVPYSARYQPAGRDRHLAVPQQEAPQYDQLTRSYLRQARAQAQLAQDQSRYSEPVQAVHEERQRLLASLNEEIRSSPAYLSRQQQQQQQQRLLRQQAAPSQQSASLATNQTGLAAASSQGAQQRQPLTAYKSVRRSYLGNRLNSFDAFHAKVDPYKSYTTSARMVPDNQLPPDGVANEAQHMTGSPSGNELPAVKLLTGPLTGQLDQAGSISPDADLIRTNNNAQQTKQQEHLRVRRDDSDDRDDADEDGVWVDDDEDDDNRQQSSDLNETAQDPETSQDEEDDGQQQDTADEAHPVTSQINPPGIIGGPHGYELSPNDLMIYNG